MTHDDGELERLRAENVEQRDQLERLASAGRMVAMLLHELGNPVSAIVNYAHTLEAKVPPDLKGTVAALQREAFRIVKLRDGFLDFVRPHERETGADINAAVRETLGFLSDQGALKRIQVDLQLSDAPKPARGSAIELEQAIANLVLNAAAAMPEGGRLVIWAERLNRRTLLDDARRRTDAGDGGRIIHPRRKDDRLSTWLESLDVDEVVKIVVADSGHGFHHGNLEELFEPFFTSKAPDEGVGLGLTVVRRVVDSMDGIVWAQRSREGGAAFHIVLPVNSGAWAGQPARTE